MSELDLDHDSELGQTLSQIETSFQKLFVIEQGGEEISRVIEALEHDELILPLVESSKGSFSSLFSPFHGGTLLLRSKSTLIEQDQLHPKLREFCRLAGEIEGMTDMMSTYEDDPSPEEKQKLLPLLREFVAKIPSHEELKSWIAESLAK